MKIRAITILVLASATSWAQPLAPPGKPSFHPSFPQIGERPQEQVLSSSVVLLAGQVTSELNSVRAEIQRSNSPAVYKPALVKLTQDAQRDTETLRALAVRNSKPDQLRAAHAIMDTSLQTLESQLSRFAMYAPGAVDAMARAIFAEQQLHAVLQQGGGLETRIERARRAAGNLENQSESLREIVQQVNDGSPGARDLERVARMFSYRASRFFRAMEKAANIRDVVDDFTLVVNDWKKFGLAYRQITPPNTLRLQAVRVENTVRSLAEMIPAKPGFPWDWDNPGPNPGPGMGFLNHGAFVVGAGEGGGPRVRLFASIRGEATYDFFAYDPAFTGGVRVAVADLNGDRVPDLVTAPGPGMPPLIRVFNGRNMRLITEFLAFDASWTGGVYVAGNDRTRDGKAWIVVGTDAGADPVVKVFDLVQGREIDAFFAYDKRFKGGVRVAVGDVNGDGVPDVLTVPGPGLEPRVKVFDGRNRNVLADFLAFDRNYTLGLTIDASDLTRNGRADMIVGTEAGGPSVVRVFDAIQGKVIGELKPFPENFRGGVRVATYDFDRDGTPDVACAPGRDPKYPPLPVSVFSGVNSRPLGNFYPFGDQFRGGAWLGSR